MVIRRGLKHAITCSEYMPVLGGNRGHGYFSWNMTLSARHNKPGKTNYLPTTRNRKQGFGASHCSACRCSTLKIITRSSKLRGWITAPGTTGDGCSPVQTWCHPSFLRRFGMEDHRLCGLFARYRSVMQDTMSHLVSDLAMQRRCKMQKISNPTQSITCTRGY